LQPKPSRSITEKVAAPLRQVSRFLSGMAVRTLKLAQRRIAVSIAALRRVLAKPPSPPAPSSPIKAAFRKRAQPRRKLRKDFNRF
jgi:hypothetical protein